MKTKRHFCCVLSLAFFFASSLCFSQRPPNLGPLLEKLDKYKSLTARDYASDSTLAGVLAGICWEYRSVNIDSAVFYCEEDIRLSKKINFQRGIATAYHQMGAIYRQMGEYDKAIEYYQHALNTWKSFSKENPGYYNSAIIILEGRTLSGMGVAYHEKGDFRKALDLYFQALHIDEVKGNKDGAASKLGNIGNVFKDQGQNDKALEYYMRSLKIDDSIGNKARMAQCYGNMGLVYWNKKDREKAIECYTKAIEINIKSGNKQLLSENYLNTAIIYDVEKNYSVAADYYNQSLQLKELTGDRHGVAVINQNLGAMYLDRNLLPEAEKNLLTARSAFDEIGAVEGQTELYKNLSLLYAKKGQYKEALEYQNKAATLKDSLFNGEKTAQLARMEADYENSKKEAIAKAEYEKEIAIANADKLRGIAEADKKRILAELNKSLELAEADKKLAEAETNKRIAITDADNKRILAEADRKKTEAEAGRKLAVSRSENERQKLIRNAIAIGAGIVILSSFLIFLAYKRKRDAVQKQKETALNLQVSETEMKALRSQMNPHFIFNALQSIQTFLMGHKPEEAHTYLLKFSKLMRLVLENSQHAEVALNEDMQALELYMQLESLRLSHPFTYKINIDRTVDTENDSIPPLILQPFVENAIWHGLQYKPAAGHIDISLSKKDNVLLATVTDNGIGRSNAAKKPKPLLDKHESLGIKLAQDRLNTLNAAKHINASFTMTDLFDQQGLPAGTQVELSLPLKG